MTAADVANAELSATQHADRVQQIAALIARSLLRDRRRLGRKLKQLRRQLRHLGADLNVPASLAGRLQRLHAECARSAAVRDQRAALLPILEFAPDLPVAAHLEQLTALIAAHQVVIVSGETGSGKSTQLPKICLAAGRGIDGRIGHTQPRRIAARAIARRIAEETGTVSGGLVGHCVRFDDNLAPHTRLKLMTDGILLNEIGADPWLEQYDTLIIDEVHERTLDIDFLLGYLKRVLARRPELKLIITSATIDIEVFTRFYDDCASYAIAGRSYPIELLYRPLDETDDDADINDAIVNAIGELDAVERGDILVFLPGEREIRAAQAALNRAAFSDTEILKLFARMSAIRQARIFQPGSQRRIILATNVAETSLTVPRVRHVIDSGLARISRYSPRRKLQQLPIEKIARANADQRRGRCGREAPGVCIRLYAESDYLGRRASVEPEIQRTNLAGVILRLKAMGIADIEQFPFAERPAERLVKDGYAVLHELGAIDADHALTASGAKLNAYPIDPRLGRVLCSAAERGCLAEALIFTAALSIADPRERPHEARDLADRAHGAFADKRSDFMWFVNAWTFARELAGMPLKRQLRRCRRLFLSATRMQEWVQLHDYLSKRVVAEGLPLNREPAGYKAIHCALASGFPSLIGEWQGEQYLGCRNSSFVLHPASILHRRAVKWILAAEIVETGRPYARLAARIDPQWLAEVAAHLLKRSYAAPHWDERRGCARVTEIQRLFGLVINADRQVDLARVDAAAARELFIDVGLVDGELGERPDFLQHNQALVARIQQLEARARRRDLVASRERLRAFYDDRLSATIDTRRSLLRALRVAEVNPENIYMSELDATSENLRSVPDYLFPDVLEIAGSLCPLTYAFEPGQAHDGIKVRVPAVLLPRLRAQDFDRLVPGMLSEKVESLLRALPKNWRRQFSPLREYAMAVVAALAERDGALDEELAAILEAVSGHAVDARLFNQAALTPHLNCLIELVNDNDECIASGRDLAALQSTYAAVAATARAALGWDCGARSEGPWIFGAIPAQVSANSAGHAVVGFAALVDCGASVELRIFDHESAAARAHLGGVARLLLLSCARETRAQKRALAAQPGMALLPAMFGYREHPCVQLAEASARHCVALHPAIRDSEAFKLMLEDFRAAFASEVNASGARLLGMLDHGARVRRQLDAYIADIPGAARTDIVSQLDALLGPRVRGRIDAEHATTTHHYLNGIERRLERLRGNPGKDLGKLEGFSALWRRFLDGAPDYYDRAAAAGRVHRLFEEYRMALFAPELGTALKVSEQQIQHELETLIEAG